VPDPHVHVKDFSSENPVGTLRANKYPMYPTQVIQGFLTPQQLSQIRQWTLEWDPGEDIVPAPIGRYTSVDPRVSHMIDSLVDHVPNEILFVRMMEAHSPGGPHADNGRVLPAAHTVPPQQFARTFIIPINTEPTHTVLFNQSMPLGISVFDHMATLKPLAPELAVGQETGQRYLTHVSPNWLSKLSIDVIFPWNAGDALIFDRNRLHCSDNWADNGLEAKQGFVIWSEIHP
jgi:hypothetical protein